MSEHTPGSWKVNNKDTGMNDSGTIESTSGIVIAPDIYGETTEQADRNAALIAAAPELLAALKLCVDALEFIPSRARNEAQQAIAKAEGRG